MLSSTLPCLPIARSPTSKCRDMTETEKAELDPQSRVRRRGDSTGINKLKLSNRPSSAQGGTHKPAKTNPICFTASLRKLGGRDRGMRGKTIIPHTQFISRCELQPAKPARKRVLLSIQPVFFAPPQA